MTDSLAIPELITGLQLAISILVEQVEAGAVTPLPRGAGATTAAGRLAQSARDLAVLAEACEVLARRAKQLSDN